MYFERYNLEFLVLSVLAILLINFALGTQFNRQLSNKWLEKVRPILTHHFVKVNDELVKEGEEDMIEFSHGSMNEYPLMCSGRQSVKYMNANLVL